MHFGFSYVGLIFLLMLFIPNGIWAKNPPKDYEEFSKNENKVLLIFERIGEVLVSTLVLIFADCNVRIHSLWIGWLVIAFILMILYECYWVKYFKSEKTMADMYSSFAGFPVAGASLPVIAVLFLGIYACNIFIILASIILGIGHIGIHLNHRKEAMGEETEKNSEKTYENKVKNSKKKKILKIIKIIVLVPIVLYVAICIVLIGIRNINFFTSIIDTREGVDEATYVELNGQQQYITIRGRKKDNPVILYLHGGPGSPDSMMTYNFTNKLIDEYTVVCWDQRGCGRTYLKNDDKENETVTADQAIEDIDALVDYLSNRFNQEKIVIIGHSYGSVIGSRYAYEHPEKTAAFIGVGQFVSFETSAECEYLDALEKAQAAGDDTTELSNAYENYVREKTLDAASEITKYAAKYHKAPRSKNTILTALVSPTFETDDVLWYTKVLNYEQFMKYNENLIDYLLEVNLRETQESYAVPVFFISGSCDWNCAVTDMTDYAEMVSGKYDIIEGCGHYVHNDDPDAFAQIVKEDLESIEY
ncbi:Pimeloyl-ACP methyl ester carboxylesterase [Lachnospiraceae bacterium NE2001]|nr:Pimeloyl-ACP methyl ester carboxylesterase [Lachnospiraceae bacterium NE2001]